MEPVRQIRTLWYNWGEWDGFYDWPAQSFRAGSNLETKQIENGACACSALVTTGLTYVWDITAVNPYDEIMFCTRDDVWDNAKVYYNWLFSFNECWAWVW